MCESLLSTCMRSGKRAKNAGVLRRAVVNLHNVIQRCLKEGELTEDHYKRQAETDNWHQRKLEWAKISRCITVKCLKWHIKSLKGAEVFIFKKNIIKSNFNQNVFFKVRWIMPAVMTTHPDTDITREDQQPCLGLMACQWMKGLGNDSQSVVQCAAKAPLWRFHPFKPPFLLLLPEHIQPFHIQSMSSLVGVDIAG